MVWPSILLFLLPSRWVLLAFSRYNMYSQTFNLPQSDQEWPYFLQQNQLLFPEVWTIWLHIMSSPQYHFFFFVCFMVSTVSDSFMWHSFNTSMPWDTHVPYVHWKVVNKEGGGGAFGKTKLSFRTTSWSYSTGQTCVTISNIARKSLHFACPRAEGELKAFSDCNYPSHC